MDKLVVAKNYPSYNGGMKSKTNKKEVSAAILTIKDADKMNDAGRKAIAEWLRQSAKNLIKHGKNYSGGFRARYIYLK